MEENKKENVEVKKCEYCRLCGTPLEEGVCPNGHNFKKMCLNCEDCGVNADGELVCKNAENLKATFDKMMSALSGITESYAVKTLEIQPVALKKPTLKCGKWHLSNEVANDFVKMFK